MVGGNVLWYVGVTTADIRLSHWILDGDSAHANLLNFAITEKNYEETTVLINVAMTTPWNMMDQLQNWASLLQDHIDKLRLTAEQVKQFQGVSWRRWQAYTEPGDELEASSPTKRTSRSVVGGEQAQEELEALPEGVLARNLGLDLVVVVTKTDYMAELEKDFDYKDEHFDFIQQAVRKFCLQYGASLFYTSVKEDKNCDLLYKYLVHRIYHFPFKVTVVVAILLVEVVVVVMLMVLLLVVLVPVMVTVIVTDVDDGHALPQTPALVVEKDAVFIPAGWDNNKKIAILYENMHRCGAWHPNAIQTKSLRPGVWGVWG